MAGGGILERIEKIEEKIKQMNVEMFEKLPINNVTNKTDITEDGYAADARQLNPALPETLSAKLQDILKYPRIRKIVEIAAASGKPLDSGSYISVNVDLTPYGFLKKPYAFLKQTTWLAVHSIIVTNVNAHVTLVNPYNDAHDDSASFILIEFL